MKKKLLLIVAIVAVFVCIFAIGVSAAELDTTKESVTLSDGTVCPLWDTDGNPTAFDPPTATTQDYLTLAIAAIVAAYARNNEEPPVKSEDIMYDAEPTEVTNLLTTVIMLRAEWYKVPDVVKPDMKPERKFRKPKNVQPPTTSTKK